MALVDLVFPFINRINLIRLKRVIILWPSRSTSPFLLFFSPFIANFASVEALYHYLWMHRIFAGDLVLCDGRPLKVLSPGVHNNDAGPDFSHAAIFIDGEKWVGNVEIHVRASDWMYHKHHDNPAYDSVILHVVAVDDAVIHRSDGAVIPQVVLPLNRHIAEVYDRFTRERQGKLDSVRCASALADIPRLNHTDWLETLSVERLQLKASRVLDYLREFSGDWNRALFVALARAMGFGLNSLPFEMTARSLPLKYVFRHADNPVQVEALLFGQAGMLDPTCNIFDEYYQTLCREYRFLAAKYGLRPINPSIWKYARTRPGNFPHRRIAILAAAISPGFNPADAILSVGKDMKGLYSLFDWKASEYWSIHPAFGAGGDGEFPLMLSKSSRTLLIINLVAPFYAARGAYLGDADLGEYAIDLLSALPAEENAVIRRWRACGLSCGDAFRSQGLLHLRREYCDRSRCLACRFGHYMIRAAAE